MEVDPLIIIADAKKYLSEAIDIQHNVFFPSREEKNMKILEIIHSIDECLKPIETGDHSICRCQ